jgi:hypothetical protein
MKTTLQEALNNAKKSGQADMRFFDFFFDHYFPQAQIKGLTPSYLDAINAAKDVSFQDGGMIWRVRL